MRHSLCDCMALWMLMRRLFQGYGGYDTNTNVAPHSFLMKICTETCYNGHSSGLSLPCVQI